MVQKARAATEGGVHKPRKLGGAPAAAPADISGDAIALLAAHFNMSAREMAERLVTTDGMTRDSWIGNFLASKGLARS
jgi:hypothetical protein